MKLEEGQKSQFIILCVLVVLVLGFGVFRLVGVKTSAAPKTASSKHSSTTDQSKSTEQSNKDSESASSADKVADTSVAIQMATAGRDPFVPQIVAQKPNEKGHSTRPAAGSSAKQMTSVLPTGIPPIGGLNVRPAFDAPKGTAKQIEVDPTKDLRLTGVIEGDTNVAIVRGAGTVRYIVHEGQAIDGKYDVESITRQGIILRFNGRKFVLRLGGNESREKGTRT